MTHFFGQLTVAAFLVFSLQQQATQSTSTLADAARVARDRQKSCKPEHVLTDDDVSPNASDAG